MIIYFDTETTGLCPGQICQLAYIIDDGKRIISKNFFFAVEYVEPSAAAVTGLTVPKLMLLSNGRVFKDDATEIYEDFCAADMLVAHNIAFDEKFIRTEFERLGINIIIKSKLCSMRYFTNKLCLRGKFCKYKNPSLAELGMCMGLNDEAVICYAQKVFDDSGAAHDARFDTAKMFLAVERAKELFPELEKLLLENL